MIAATTVSILYQVSYACTILCAIATYLIGFWVTMFIFGMNSGIFCPKHTKMDTEDFMFSLLWPLTFLVAVLFIISEGISQAARALWHLVPKRAWVGHVLSTAFKWATIVFRPFELGQRLRNYAITIKRRINDRKRRG